MAILRRKIANPAVDREPKALLLGSLRQRLAVEIQSSEASNYATLKRRYISTDAAASVAVPQLSPWIVIPVVVGSSPISHPK
jgi:hypothetical protein